jgi:phage major head subunit gpT-like protein
MLGIARTDLINDDLGALSGAARRLGRGAGLKLNDVFWRVFLNNATFFAAGNNNVLTGVTAGPTNSALGLEGLQNADRVFRLQTDPDGQPLGVMAKKLVVPTSLRITALNLMNATNIQSGNTVSQPDANVFAGQFDVVSSPYMQNAAYTGNSATAWYLLADPADLPVIEVCFLNGVESPTVETADADFHTLGISMRGFHDFGTSLMEYRGGVRAAGA